MFEAVVYNFMELLQTHTTLSEYLLLFTPFVVFLELPFVVMVIVGVLLWAWRNYSRNTVTGTNTPKVSCVLLCYNEKEAIVHAIDSLAYQLYPGEIEILVMIDGALQNEETYRYALAQSERINALQNRSYRVFPKWQRGGRVSSMNYALSLAGGEIFMALDGDTVFDNDMVQRAVTHFEDENVVAVSGNLRVRNASSGISTRLQAIEYMVSITFGRTGLGEFNMVNNISGAFGVFRTRILRLVSGWQSGTAEDLDLTMRLKEYFGRKKEWRIVFDPHCIGHTEVPEGFFGFLKQRLRWEGDLFYIIGRKYHDNLRHDLLGAANYFFTLVGIYFFQIVMPFVITLYTVLILYAFALEYVIAISLFVYLFYLGILTFIYLLYLLLISERPKEDFQNMLYLPLYPMFTFVARLNAAFALLHSIFNRSHLDSNMAPWWVLRKSKV